MQSRLEEEEEAKAALMSRIQRLTKLILVSTKNTIPGLPDVPGHQRSHSDDVSPPHVFCKFCYCLISNGAEI
jgi:centromeric protein E